jgi:hypothetical protein
LFSNAMNGHKTVRFSSGNSQYLTVAASDSAMSGVGSFTMAVVFKTSTPGASSSSFYQNTGLIGCEQPNIVPDWALCLNGSQLGAGLGAGSGGCSSDLSLYGGNVADGKSHIAVYARSGDAVSLYVDGVNNVTQSALCTAARGNYDFQIGAMTPGTLCFNGDIAEINLYDRSLNSWELMSVNEILAATYGINTGIAGSVVVWGDNTYGQTASPTPFTNVLAGACGGSFNLVLSENGPLTEWGNNGAGQTNIPKGLTNVVAVAGGAAFSLAIADQAPLVNSLTANGYVNHDLTLGLPGFDPDGVPLSFYVTSLPAVGTLFQYSGTGRGAVINGTNALVTDQAGRVVFAPGQGDVGSPYDSFNFAAGDGQYNSDSARAVLNIGLPAQPQLTSGLWNQSNPGAQNFQLSFTGDSNATYSVWASTNLIDWANIGTAGEANPGQYQFIDGAATNWPQRFYRAGAP